VLGRLKQGRISLRMIELGGDTTGNGVSKLVFTILSVAEAERDRTRERIAEVKRVSDEEQRRVRELVKYLAADLSASD
jgi:DNA invertase Pin-like site-specific DNA recombinase